MKSESSFASILSRLREFIDASSTENRSSTELDLKFNRLALDLFARQYATVPAYRNFCDYLHASPKSISIWSDIPAMPASAFKDFEITSLAPDERSIVFRSSGTTGQRPGRHFHSRESLSLYEASLLPWFQENFFPGRNAAMAPKSEFIFLTPPPSMAPHSSLVHMLEFIRFQLGSENSFFAGSTAIDGAWTIDMESVVSALRRSMRRQQPVALLGTAFSLVHLLDHFDQHQIRFDLPRGSQVMETGGYKGRSRTVPRSELHRLLSQHLAISPEQIVSEYGMSELSSQAYARVNPCAGSPLIFRFPSWVRVRFISPESGGDARVGEAGLLRIFDLANARSVLAIQTGDLAVAWPNGFELIGRAPEAEARGCSLMAAESN